MPDKTGPKPDFERELVALLPRLRRFACGLAGSLADGDDLVQGAIAKALVNRDHWQPGTRLDSWMYRIIQNHWIDTVRARRTRASIHAANEGAQEAMSDGVRTAEAVLTVSETKKHIAALPDDQRSVLLLVAVEGLSYAQAAEALGVPIGTIMSRLARARSSLAKSVFGEDGSPV